MHRTSRPRFGRREFLMAAASSAALAKAPASGHHGPADAIERRVVRRGAPAIGYTDRGQGTEALLFLPGWCVSRSVFQSLPDRCAAARRSLALDWRGHGDSAADDDDFGAAELVQDAVDVIRDAGISRVTPVALAHSGWIALGLRRRLGAMIGRVVLIDWLVLEPPPAFTDALRALQDPEAWRAARDGLLASWTRDLGHPDLEQFIARDMGSHGFDMWRRAGREIARAYAEYGSPFRAFAELDPTLPVLHLYAQPDDSGYLAAQQALAAEHSWFHVRKLAARSHFPMFEVPKAMADAIVDFVAGGAG